MSIDKTALNRIRIKVYKDRTIHDINEMQLVAFELMRDYIIRKEAGHLGLKKVAQLFGRKKEEMEDEETHGKKPVRDIKNDFNKEAWDKLKYEHDGVLEVRLENDSDVKQLVDILNSLSELPKDIGKGTKNSAEIFCRVTGKGYMDFNRYSSMLWDMSPKDTLNLPFVVDEAVRKVSLIEELSELDLNVLILVYTVYKAKYEPAKYPYGASDIIFDIVDAAIELKKEGMIQ